MEGRAFLKGFGIVPSPVASRLEGLLDRSNARRRAASDDRHLVAYRHVADSLAGRADLVVFGHIHRAVNDSTKRPRLIVLGDWLDGSSYLVVGNEGARLIVDARF